MKPVEADGGKEQPVYTAADSQVQTDAGLLLGSYRDVERFLALCRECPNFGRSWACPPLDPALEAELQGYREATLFLTKIIPDKRYYEGANASPDLARRMLLRERMRLDPMLLERERTLGGRVFSFVGSCAYCTGPQGCTRLQGLPCRHPDKVRPSLEAFGFNLEAIARDFFSTQILWASAPDELPPYLLLLTAHFR